MRPRDLIDHRPLREHGRRARWLDAGQLEAVRRLNERIAAGELELESVPCLCGGDDFDGLATIDWFGVRQRTVICRRCGLVQSNPRMTADETARFYGSDDYRRLYDGEDFAERYQARYAGGGESIVATLLAVEPTLPAAVGEIGCGGGWNLVAFHERGIAARGYDLSPALVELGRGRGLDLVRGGVDAVEGTYDVLIANHVVEHLLDPVADVAALTEHLAPDGRFYVQVPDITNFGIGQLQSAHTYYFTPRTLEHYLGRAGLRMVHTQPEVGGHVAAVLVHADGWQPPSLDGHYDEMVRLIRAAVRRDRVTGPVRAVLERVLQRPV
jgi:SAM-dependent methyltransferase